MSGLTSSVLSYPERGPWGVSSYRGNTTGYIVMDFLGTFHRDKTGLFVDPMQGSGTSKDVAKEMNIPYAGFDLKTGFDILSTSLLGQLERPAHSAFLHPPYKDMIAYGGGAHDLSSFPKVEDFLEWMELALYNVYNAILPGAHYAVLMGNMRRDGKFYPLSSMVEMIAPGEEVVQCIKVQHNVTSSRSFYPAGSFVPTMHEMLMIFKKPENLTFCFDIAIKHTERSERLVANTWRNLVRLAMMDEGGTMTLARLYEKIEGTSKARGNSHWREKVRQTVQVHSEFRRISAGTYQLGLAV